MNKTLSIILICFLGFSMSVAQDKSIGTRPQSFSRQLNVGWNWIGFPHSRMPIEDALAHVNPIDGDYIKSQSSSATYYEEYGWFVELTHLAPLQGYHIKISHIETFTVRFIDGQGSFTDARDGHTYKWVRIGTQIWMAENLAWLPNVSPSFHGSETDPYHYVYGYEGSNVSEAKATRNYAEYGALYNHESALSACPNGWHLPSDAEWNFLTDYLSLYGYAYDYADEIGKSMASVSGWINSSHTGAIGNDQTTNNSSGFNAFPGGWRHNLSSYFGGLGGYAGFWTSSYSGPLFAWNYNLTYNSKDVGRSKNLREYAFSVRCIQD